jgi:hypothetical protein
MLKGLNWIGIAAALVVTQGLSFLWYAKLFAHALTEPLSPAAKTPLGMAEAALFSLITLIGLAWVLRHTGRDNLVGGVLVAALLWLCFPLMGEAMDWLYMGRDLAMVQIDSGFSLIYMLVSGALIGGLELGGAKAAAG